MGTSTRLAGFAQITRCEHKTALNNTTFAFNTCVYGNDKHRNESGFKILPKLTKGVVHLLRHYLCLDNLFIFLSNCLRFSRIRKSV